MKFACVRVQWHGQFCQISHRLVVCHWLRCGEVVGGAPPVTKELILKVELGVVHPAWERAGPAGGDDGGSAPQLVQIVFRAM